METGRHMELGRDHRGQVIYFKGTVPVTSFLQMGPSA